MISTVRWAKVEDAPQILHIYNHAALHTTAVWNDRPSTIEERLAWLRQQATQGYPVLVAEAKERVVGFASFGDFRRWDGYRHTVESSVYVAPEFQGHGIGRKLVDALVREALGLGKHVMIAGIEASNTASVRLHRSVGFIQVARLPEVGCKFGRWLDLVLMQRTLHESGSPL